MHNTMYNKYQEERRTVSKRKKGGSCFLNIYTEYFSIILGPGGKINTPFCGKKVDTNTKNVKIEKNTRESSKHHTHTKDFKVEWMDFYGTMKSLLVKFTSVFLLGICFLEVLLLHIYILSFRDQDECKIIFFQK